MKALKRTLKQVNQALSPRFEKNEYGKVVEKKIRDKDSI
jgi:hypothetical protein